MLAQLVVASVLAIALGISTGTERFMIVGILLGGAAVFLSSLNWRRHLIPLILGYVCFEGFFSLMFKQYKASLLVKDFLIIIAYMSFLMEMVSEQRQVFFRGVVVPMATMAMLGLAEIFNPGLPNMLVGVVGFKILCFYMPLVLLGYYCFNSLQEVRKSLLYMLAFTIPVGLMAVWQYAEGPSAITRFGSGFKIALIHTPSTAHGTHLRAIGTFSSPAMLSLYCLFATAMAITVLGWPRAAKRGWLPWAALLLAVLALLASGTRGGMIITVMMCAAMLLILGKARYLPVGAGLAVLGLFLLASTGEGVFGRTGSLLNPATWSGRLTAAYRMTAAAIGESPIGRGLGYASVGARYVMPDGKPVFMAETYTVKLAYEMGIFGLLVQLWLAAVVVAEGIRCSRQARTPEAKWAATCLAVFTGGIMVLSLAGAMALDMIPLNVYFWFLLGVMLRIPEMRQEGAAQAPPVRAAYPPPPLPPRPVRAPVPGEPPGSS
ncbi:MAG: O-antigen ligase family protein [Planctomycetota bacterium]|jgi:hypothetical protein